MNQFSLKPNKVYNLKVMDLLAADYCVEEYTMIITKMYGDEICDIVFTEYVNNLPKDNPFKAEYKTSQIERFIKSGDWIITDPYEVLLPEDLFVL